MTEIELIESQELGRMVAEIEVKLAFWRKQGEVCERMVQNLVERMATLLLRQKALIEGKAAGAAG